MWIKWEEEEEEEDERLEKEALVIQEENPSSDTEEPERGHFWVLTIWKLYIRQTVSLVKGILLGVRLGVKEYFWKEEKEIPK